MSRVSDSSSSGAQGRGGAAYPSGTPPYGKPREDADEAIAAGAAAQPEEPKTETTVTTRIKINIPGSRPIPPVVVRKSVGEESGMSGSSGAAGSAGPAGAAGGGERGPERPGLPTRPAGAARTGGGARPAAAAESSQGRAAEKEKTSDWFAPRKPTPTQARPSAPAGAPGGAPASAGNPGGAPAPAPGRQQRPDLPYFSDSPGAPSGGAGTASPFDAPVGAPQERSPFDGPMGPGPAGPAGPGAGQDRGAGQGPGASGAGQAPGAPGAGGRKAPAGPGASNGRTGQAGSKPPAAPSGPTTGPVGGTMPLDAPGGFGAPAGGPPRMSDDTAVLTPQAPAPAPKGGPGGRAGGAAGAPGVPGAPGTAAPGGQRAGGSKGGNPKGGAPKAKGPKGGNANNGGNPNNGGAAAKGGKQGKQGKGGGNRGPQGGPGMPGGAVSGAPAGSRPGAPMGSGPGAPGGPRPGAGQVGDTLVGGIPAVPGGGGPAGPTPFPTGPSAAANGAPAAPRPPLPKIPEMINPPKKKGRGSKGPKGGSGPKGGGAPKKKGRSKIVLLGVGIVFVAGVAYGAGLLLDHADVPNGTTALGVDIGGLSKDEAVKRLDSALKDRLTQPLKITVDGQQRTLQPERAGLGVDTQTTVRNAAGRDYNPVSVVGALFGGSRPAKPAMTVDDEKLTIALQQLAGPEGQAKEGGITFEDGKAVPHYGTPYKSVDVKASKEQVADAYRQRVETGKDTPLVLAATEQQPKVSKEEVDRAMKEFAEPAMSGMVTIQADPAHRIPFSPQRSIPKFLSMTVVEGGKLMEHYDLQKLEQLYGNAFAGVTVNAAEGPRPVQPKDVANALSKALRGTTPAERIGTIVTNGS
ncbi:hypothetical protein [Streptomyces sp. NPDC003077]|uniref:hypothetical protein n=1 Tax=Streptomyces sp. NPDC003077 TaxID=3154443 RepID=UPI0033AA285E